MVSQQLRSKRTDFGRQKAIGAHRLLEYLLLAVAPRGMLGPSVLTELQLPLRRLHQVLLRARSQQHDSQDIRFLYLQGFVHHLYWQYGKTKDGRRLLYSRIYREQFFRPRMGWMTGSRHGLFGLKKFLVEVQMVDSFAAVAALVPLFVIAGMEMRPRWRMTME